MENRTLTQNRGHFRGQGHSPQEVKQILSTLPSNTKKEDTEEGLMEFIAETERDWLEDENSQRICERRISPRKRFSRL